MAFTTVSSMVIFAGVANASNKPRYMTTTMTTSGLRMQRHPVRSSAALYSPRKFNFLGLKFVRGC